jgi:prophage antirepressor
MEVFMDISTFNNSEFGEIRTIQNDSGILFCGSDVARALGYARPADAISAHCKGVCVLPTPSAGGVQNTKFITEGDVYRLIAHSKLPGAERFERWVFDEVLPSIRKHGAYLTEDVLEQALTSPDFLIELATRLKTEKAKNAQLTVSNQIMQPKADYFDMLVDRNLLTGIRDTAKELGIRQNDFVRFLLDKGYLFRTKKGKLRPYATYVDSGLFEMKEFVNDKTGYMDTQTLITPKGKETFRLLCI